MDLAHMICAYVDEKDYSAMDVFLLENYSRIRCSDLDKAIRWGGKSPNKYQHKNDKFEEVRRINQKRCKAAKMLDGYSS